MAKEFSPRMTTEPQGQPNNSSSHATECTDVHADSDCVNSSNTPPIPKVKRIVDLKNEPKVKPGEMLEDAKFTQH